jgi:hypothetical protein
MHSRGWNSMACSKYLQKRGGSPSVRGPPLGSHALRAALGEIQPPVAVNTVSSRPCSWERESL